MMASMMNLVPCWLRRSVQIGAAAFIVPVCAQNLAPNPGMETGADQPAGWKLSGGDEGKWVSPGRQGGHCLSVTGDGANSFFWRSDELGLKPGGLYRLRFWARREAGASGGCAVAGLSRVNRDFQLSENWESYSFAFTVPADEAKDFIRLGQWEKKGTVYFDDVELTPLAPLFAGAAYGKGLRLGEGETIENGVYRCVVNLGGPSGNCHRALLESRCGFNTDRWTFSDGQRLIYAHELHAAGGSFTQASLKLNICYYAGGTLKVEASANGTAWESVAVLDHAGEGAKTALPAPVLGSRDLFVRLTGAGAACSIQVNRYELEATVPELAKGGAAGRTAFLETLLSSPDLEVTPDTALWAGPAGARQFSLSVKNKSSSTLDLGFWSTIDREVKRVAVVPELAAGGSARPNVSIRPSKPGVQDVSLAVSDEAGRTLYIGRMSLACGILDDPRPGYWLGEKPGLGLWWCESGWKIGRDHGSAPRPADGRPRPVRLSAARGEFEAAQVILNPQQAGELVGASAGPLRDSQGRPGAIKAELLEVAYVKVTHPTDETCEAGWYPDPLPPLRLPMKLGSGVCQPIWVSLCVGRNTPAGDYTGELELKTSAGDFAVPLNVHVYDFELPAESHLKSALGLETGNINLYHHLTSAADQRQVYESYLTNFAAHRITPYSFSDYDPIDIRFSGEGANKAAKLDFTAFDRAAEKWLDEYHFSSFDLPLRGMGGGTFQSRTLGDLEGFKEGTPEHARLFKDYLSQVEAHLRQRGWLDKAYTYWFDEPAGKDFEFVSEGMKRIRAAAPGLRRMLTKEPHPELEGNVEIWCALTPEWTPEKVQGRRAAGEEVWWYICCGPHAPYVTEFIDHPGTELRLWPWQSWQYGVQGILIWATTYWTSSSAFPGPQHQEPWTDPMSYVSGYDFKAGQIGYWGNGDGRFLYPPREAAGKDSACLEPPVTSFRWENLRDGLEDYEYLWLLQKAVEQSASVEAKAGLRREAERLLKVPSGISQDTRHFTTDPRAILEQRDRIARLIEQLAPGR